MCVNTFTIASTSEVNAGFYSYGPVWNTVCTPQDVRRINDRQINHSYKEKYYSTV